MLPRVGITRASRSIAPVRRAAILSSVRTLSSLMSASRSLPLCSSSRPKTVTAVSTPHTSFTHQSRRSFSNFTEVVPGLGDSISDAVVIQWEKNVGDYVYPDDVMVILETDKVSVDIRATQAGKIVELKAGEGDTVMVGDNLVVLDTSAEPPAKGEEAAAPAAEAPPPPPSAAAASTPTPAAAAASTPAPAAAEPAATAPATSGPSRAEHQVPLSRMRLTIAKRLKDAQNTAAMLTTFNEIDMSGIMALRAKHKDEFVDKHGVKLGFMSIFVKAASNALLRNPTVNAYLDIENKCTVYRDYVDISVAVATPTGLVVPVLRNCESMTFAGVEGAIADLGKRARAGKIGMEDMVGGNFTITNGGVFGSLMGTPIINPPQTSVLGMHGIFKRPVAVGDKVEIRPMMYVALTYDHRLLDGSDAVVFLKDIKMQVEDPARVMLDI